ncbi:MAG: spermidine/putrescine ABC transporter substrate-binding protein [Caldilineaceae bacterium]
MEKPSRISLSLIIFSLSLVVVLAACGGTGDAPAASSGESPAAAADAGNPTPAEASLPEFCGDPSKLSAELRFFNWADYMDENIMTQFGTACGVKVTQDIYSSNEDLIAKLQAGNAGYDLVIPSDYAVQILINADLLHPLDMVNIPNVANIDPNLMGMYYDPENTYSIPYQWGTTGIAYNTTAYPDGVDSWAALFDPAQVCKQKGFASMLDDERESIGATLKYLGYSYNDTDPDHQAQARDVLLAQKPCLAGYNSDNYNQTLASEEVMIAHAWSGGTALARSENENVKFVIPKEGGTIWMDNMTIPADAPNTYTAEIFINYLLSPEIGAQLSNYTYYFTPNLAAQPLLDPAYHDLLESGGMLVDDAVRARLEWIKRDDQSIIFSDTWTAVKAR